jgi:hypothetical protein
MAAKKKETVWNQATPEAQAALRAPMKAHPNGVVGARTGPGSPGYIPKKRRPSSSSSTRSSGRIKPKMADTSDMGWKRKMQAEDNYAGAIDAYNRDSTSIATTGMTTSTAGSGIDKAKIAANADMGVAGLKAQSGLDKQNLANQGDISTTGMKEQGYNRRQQALFGQEDRTAENLASTNEQSNIMQGQFDLAGKGFTNVGSVNPFNKADFGGYGAPPADPVKNKFSVEEGASPDGRSAGPKYLLNEKTGDFTRPQALMTPDELELMRLKKDNANYYNPQGN